MSRCNATDLGNEETLSNQSGDTELLTDDDLASVLEHETYAAQASEAAREQECDLQQRVNLEEKTDEERFFGADWFVTPFERANYLPENILPARPCTAYLAGGDYKDSKELFGTLEQLKFPLASISCVQRQAS